MNSFFGRSLITTILTVIASIALYHYTTSKPDLRLQVSPKLPSSFTEQGNGNFLQIFTVSNVGEVAVEDVQFLIDEDVLRYQVEKNSNIDTYEDKSTKDSIAIIYSKLMPSSKFTVSVLSSSNNYKSPSVKFDGGEASIDDGTSYVSLIFSMVLALLSIIYLMAIIRAVRVSRLRRLNLDSIDKKKPILISRKEFTDFVEDASDILLFKEIYRLSYASSFSDLITVNKANRIISILDSDNLTQESKESLTKSANEYHLYGFIHLLQATDGLQELQSLLKSEHPEFISSDIKERCRKKTLDRIRNVSFQPDIGFRQRDNIKVITCTLTDDRLEGLEHIQYQELKEIYVNSLELSALNMVIHNIQYSNALGLGDLSFVAEHCSPAFQDKFNAIFCKLNIIDLDILKFGSFLTLENVSHLLDSPPDWAQGKAWDSFTKVCNTLKYDLEFQQEVFNFFKHLKTSSYSNKYVDRNNLISELRNLIEEVDAEKSNISEKEQQLIDDSEAEKSSLSKQKQQLSEESKQLIAEQSEVLEKSLSLNNLRSELESEIANVRAQLQLIDDSLNGGNALDIEEYPEKIFKPQNIKNLRRVSELVKA